MDQFQAPVIWPEWMMMHTPPETRPLGGSNNNLPLILREHQNPRLQHRCKVSGRNSQQHQIATSSRPFPRGEGAALRGGDPGEKAGAKAGPPVLNLEEVMLLRPAQCRGGPQAEPARARVGPLHPPKGAAGRRPPQIVAPHQG